MQVLGARTKSHLAPLVVETRQKADNIRGESNKLKAEAEIDALCAALAVDKEMKEEGEEEKKEEDGEEENGEEDGEEKKEEEQEKKKKKSIRVETMTTTKNEEEMARKDEMLNKKQLKIQRKMKEDK